MIKQVVKKTFLSINLFFAIGLLIALLSIYISPANLPFISITGLALPYLVVFNLLFLGIWLLIRQNYLLISATTLFISIPVIINSLSFPKVLNSREKQATFSVLSYNVRVFDLYNWSNNKQTRNKIFQLIRNEKTDIGCFQEYFNNNNGYFPVHDSLITNQKFKYSHIFYNVNIKNGHNFGIATYSAYPIINKKNIKFNNTHNHAIITDIKINNDTLRIINCHLESVRFLVSDYQFIDSISLLTEKRRLEGAKGVSKRLLNSTKKRALQAEKIANEINNSPYKTIVCGDFNDPPYSYTYNTIQKGLKDSFRNHKFGLGSTFNRFFPPMRIDYQLHDKHIECHEFKTIKKNYSDHLPIIGKYSILQ